MIQCFTSLLNSNGATRITAPLNAGTLLDVQICQRDAGRFIDPLADLGTIGLSVDGVEVLPRNFPLRWLVQVLGSGEFRYPDRRLAINCWGAGSTIEVVLDGQKDGTQRPEGPQSDLPQMARAAEDYIAVFRYDTISTPLLGSPYRYHVARKRLDELLAVGGPMQLVDLQRKHVRGAPVGIAVDWCFLKEIPDRATFEADLLQRGKTARLVVEKGPSEMGGFANAYGSCEGVKGIFDGLAVRVSGTMTQTVNAPLGIVRPSLRQSLEDALLRLPPQFGNTVTVAVTVPLDNFAPMEPVGDVMRRVVESHDVEFTSVVIERVKERNNA